ncbi:MAG: efflux RND transporter permease subunit [Tepidisphaeraceae bacterium]|jgi:CzcA family heavy metal efflux pump
MKSSVGRFAIRHGLSIAFLVAAVALTGGYAARHMPSAVFPQTDFPRVIIMVDNGVMPADEMMATITRPIEEAMKEIQGCETIRSSTGRGSAEIDLFFSWHVDMHLAEVYTQARLSQIRASLPPTATAEVYRMTFSTFPIIGLSLTGPGGDSTQPWELARYILKPKLLRMPGVSRVDLLGGRVPEYEVAVDPVRLSALGLSLADVVDTLAGNNLIVPSGLHREDYSMYLTEVDGRARSTSEIEELTVGHGSSPVPIRDFATVTRGSEPAFSVVTADGEPAVLLNIFSQPDASTLDIARQLKELLPEIRRELPPAMKITYFYDQSLLVNSSLHSVWDSMIFGLILSVLILFIFLKNWPMTLVATLVIPITMLTTILALKICGLSFNLMTLGGLVAAIGLVIDDAIVVVEAIYAKVAAGLDRAQTVESAVGEILPPLVGSTLTPVVVFVPLAFLTGIAGVFFRSLAITMVVALLTSLVLALTLTPALAAWVIGAVRTGEPADSSSTMGGGFFLRLVIAIYERLVGAALKFPWITVGLAIFMLMATGTAYTYLKTDFLPKMDEGGFIIDYITPPGTSLQESDRMMREAERILRNPEYFPEVESFSRRTGAALGVGLVEPNTGDFLVKLKADRHRDSDAIVADLRHRLNAALPRVDFEFPGILTDLIGDLIWADEPIEIKIISPDAQFRIATAKRIQDDIEQMPGVVDLFNGLVYTGSCIDIRVRSADAQRLGLSTAEIGRIVNIAMLGQTTTSVMEQDRTVNIRVKADAAATDRIDKLKELPLRAEGNRVIRLDQVADIEMTPPQLELHRDDLRQDDAVTADLQGRDLGGAMAEIQSILGGDRKIPPETIEYGGLYQQQQESFANLTLVLISALVLVFTVALLEFRSFSEPIAIVGGAALSVFGIVAALLITGTTLNIVTYLGAIIGMGIVHKNGLLMLDHVKQLRSAGIPLEEALIQSGRRRLRPVLMTSLAAALGMLPLAYGFESADMLRPLAIAVIGAVCVSVVFSLVATPVFYFLMSGTRTKD